MYVNHHFTASITYHDSINGFQAIQGMGTTTPEVNLLQHVTAMREEELHAMFLDLYNAYNALDRYRCLDILEEYGVGPRALRLLCWYWDRLQMVVQAGGNYVEPFRGERGVMQGYPLLPTIFNVVLDAVVRQCESLVEEQAGGGRSDNNDDAAQPAGKTIRARNYGGRQMEEGHVRLKLKTAFFYADNGMVASTNPGWLHTAFNMLTGIFYWVRLQKNVRKTVGVVCQPFCAAGVRADKAYIWRMTG